MKFRPCIDLMEGKVVQIIGSTLTDNSDQKIAVKNFQSARTPDYFARLYKADRLSGGHVIALGAGNKKAVLEAISAYSGGLQVGGGITPDNAGSFLDAGASHVIVTSYVFSKGRIDMGRLSYITRSVGKNRLVLDLSCRKKGNDFWIVTDCWQTFTKVAINQETLSKLSEYCDEFLIHGVDVEGKMKGIQTELVAFLGENSPITSTYAGGVSNMSDIDEVNRLGKGRVDITIGSSLDIFGGHLSYRAVVKQISALGRSATNQ